MGGHGGGAAVSLEVALAGALGRDVAVVAYTSLTSAVHHSLRRPWLALVAVALAR